MARVVETAEPTGGAGQIGPEVPEAIIGRGPWQIFWGRFKKDHLAVAASIFIIILIVAAFGAPLFAKYVAHRGPNDFPDNTNGLTNAYNIPIVGPGTKYWGGVDVLGRDVFVRTLYGARTSIEVAVIATGISVVVGIVLGLLAGFKGGWIDTMVSRAVDIVLSLPILLLAIGIAAACSTTATGCLGGTLQPGIGLVVAIIALFGWPYMARIVRGQTLSVREREFIEAARSTGFGTMHIMFREILPNLVAPIIVYTTLLIPTNIIFEATLTFLGVGIPPDTPSWGGMISDATEGYLYQYAWWMLMFPGMGLVLTTLSFNLLGDGMRDALDPRMGR